MRTVASSLLLSMSLTLIPAIHAQSASQSPLPNRPISLVVPFAAGGGTDVLARLVAAKLEMSLHQAVVVENKPGATGLLGAQLVERSAPDGSTLLFGSTSTHVIAPLLSPDKQAIETLKSSFRAVSMLAVTTLVLAVGEKSEFRNLDQYLNNSRAGGVTYGTFGAGSSAHLMGAFLAAKRGTHLLHVPYKGSAPAITDLLGGNIDSVFLTASNVISYVEAKQIRALAVTGAERLSTFPDVPTFKESGVAGLENAGWFAIFVPAKTPDNIVSFLNGELRKIMAAPDIQARLPGLGLQKREGTLQEDEELWADSIADMQNIVRETKFDLNGN